MRKGCHYERHLSCFQCACYPQRSWNHRLSSPAAPERADKHPQQANSHSSSSRDEPEPRLSRRSMFTVRGAKLGRHDTAESLRSKSAGSGCTTWHHVTWLSRGLGDAAFTIFFFRQRKRIKIDREKKPCKLIKIKHIPPPLYFLFAKLWLFTVGVNADVIVLNFSHSGEEWSL